MADRLAGKVAIVTGAARGQGEAEARLFAAEGARVVVADVLVDEGAAVAASVGEAARFVRVDVTSADDWAAAVDAAGEWGGADVLVNNAGVVRRRRLEHETEADLRRVLDVNLVGPFLGMQAVIAPMRARGGGSIVNISSTGGLTGHPSYAAYNSSKWGLTGLTRTAAVELAADGIRVNSVHPGPIQTEMLGLEEGGYDPAAVFPHVPMGRAGTVEEVAALVLHLASDESSFTTGGQFVIDGGSLAGPPPTG